MSIFRALTQRTLRAAAPVGLSGLLFIGACIDDQAGIVPDEAAGKGPVAGKAGKGGSGGEAAPGTAAETGGDGSAGSGASQSGGGTHTAGGSDTVNQGGTTTGGGIGEGGQATGQGGEGEAGAAPVATTCVFHTDAPIAQGGTGGTGGTDGIGGSGGTALGTVVVQTNAFIGSYLTDAAGRTLYTYGVDLPGDCHTPPKSLCVADCLVSWPIFDAGQRVLGAGLDDAAFGSIDRGDGTWQTTYYGWPLYYYKTDLTLGQLTGQGKSKTWHAAEVIPLAVMIMKAGANRYLGDAVGHTLYVSAADQPGTLLADPISACAGECLMAFKPFSEKHLSVVTSLEESDFSVFIRADAGGLQIAYKGLPLYSATTDLKSGDTTGLASAGFTAAVP